jgi:hypothetical protein
VDLKRINPKTMYKVRFHLAQGENFMKWQVKLVDSKEVQYYDPEEVTLLMSKCKLRNQASTAKKINEGANKTVCAWIDCENVRVLDRKIPQTHIDDFVRFNPRIKPYWMGRNESDNLDNQEIETLWTDGRNILTTDICE